MRMKKAILMILLALISISVLNGCGNKHKYYDLETTLGDKLTFEIYLSGNLHGLYPTYCIDGDNLKGRVYFRYYYTKSETLPDDPLSSFEEMGRYGDTNFYRFLDDEAIIWVNSNKYLGWFDATENMSSYLLEAGISENDTDYMNAIDEARADMLLTENIDYIYQVGTVLAQKESNDIRPLLERYELGDFSDGEISSFNESTHTQEEIIQWAKEMLEQYYKDNADSLIPFFEKDLRDGRGVSFSTVPAPGCAMTTIEALNATGIVYAIETVQHM